jgi:hypothetical protein
MMVRQDDDVFFVGFLTFFFLILNFIEKHMITDKLKAGADNIKAKAAEIDAQYKITETVQAGVNAVTDKAKAVDERFGISATANAAFNTVSATAQAATSAVTAKVCVARNFTVFVERSHVCDLF